MKDDLIIKIKRIIDQKNLISEDEVRSLMGIIRKILDKIDPNNCKYLILRLFCNWSAHTEITNSNTGLRILAKINDTLVEIKDMDSNFEIRCKISEAIGFVSLRRELANFFKEENISDILISDNKLWSIYLDHLIEIIRDVPISFPPLSELDETKIKIYNEISQNPIKPGAGVISILISLFAYPKEGEEIMSIFIRTEDTTTLVIPLLIDVSLE
jgi:hypothetical protein